MKNAFRVSLVLILIGLIVVFTSLFFLKNSKNNRSVFGKIFPWLYPDYENNGIDESSQSLDTAKLLMQKNWSTEDINSIEIFLEKIKCNIYLESSQDDKFYLSLYEHKNTKDEIKVMLENKALKIICTKDNFFDQKLNLFKLFNKNKEAFYTLRLNVPAKKLFKTLNIENAFGVLNIKDIKTEVLKFQAGAGKSYFENISAERLDLEGGVGNIHFDTTESKRSTIQSGIGSVSVSDSCFANLDFQGGIGNFTFSGRIPGSSKIEAGIGNIEIKINDKKENYKMEVNNGIGLVSIDGKSAKYFENNRNAENTIKLDAGIGNVKIEFE